MVMLYTLTFSKKVGDKREPFIKDGREYTMQVEADSRTAAIHHPEVVAFCKEETAAVRRVMP